MKTESNIANQSKWLPELTDLIRRLWANKVVIKGASYDSTADPDSEAYREADPKFSTFGSMPSKVFHDLAEFAAQGDDGYIITTIDGKDRWIKFVFGNKPGEMVSDWVVCPELDKVCTEHGEAWESAVPQLRKAFY